MRKTPMPPRTKPMRRTRVKPVNAKRKASEFARCYHSRARVRFVKSLPCCVCTALHPLFAIGTAGRSDNAHLHTDGASRRADYDQIVPLCREHHRRYDERIAPLDDEKVRAAVARMAEHTERAWRAAQGGEA